MTTAELTIQVTTLTVRLENTNKMLEVSERVNAELKADHKKLSQEHSDCRRDTDKVIAGLVTEIAVLKKEVEELKKSKDLWGNRAFTLATCFVSAVLGAIGGIVATSFKKP